MAGSWAWAISDALRSKAVTFNGLVNNAAAAANNAIVDQLTAVPGARCYSGNAAMWHGLVDQIKIADGDSIEVRLQSNGTSAIPSNAYLLGDGVRLERTADL